MKGRRDPDALSGASDPPDGPSVPTTRRGPLAQLRVSPGRVAAAVIALGLAWWAAWVLMDRSRRWVHSRPEYEVSFDAITLDPPPPPEVRGGSETILSRVRDRSKLNGPIRMLDQDLGELGRLFAKYSDWVAGVERVRRQYPGRISVRLAYRVPVARLDIDGDGARFVGLSVDGVVLPGEEVAPDAASALVRIARRKADWDIRPGRFLSPDERGQVAPEVASALRLARFLRGREPRDGQIKAIHVDRGVGQLYARTRRGEWVAWRNGPGDEAEGEPKAEDKLDRLIRWEDANPATRLGPGEFLRFTRDSIEVKNAGQREDRKDSRPVEGKG